jgi:flagellar protein FlaG
MINQANKVSNGTGTAVIAQGGKNSPAQQLAEMSSKVKYQEKAAHLAANRDRDQNKQAKEGKKRLSPEQELERSMEFLSKFAKVFDFKLQFRVHKETNRIFSKILDPDTDKVLREIPPEKMLDMAARMEKLMEEMGGIMLDNYV